jgi:transcriptional regulator with XRE-family HTH domain
MAFSGSKLLKWRMEMRLSQEDAAKEIGITQTFLSELESGKKTPSFVTLEAIAEKTRIPIGEFSTANSPSTPSPEGAKKQKPKPVMKDRHKHKAA